MKFTKVSLALAGMAAATLFAPEASAIPAFARQVGMACSACHYQHFPELNSFGRAFKRGGYTMVGAQEKIEGEGLSLPAVENLAIVGYVQYAKTNGPTTGSTPTTKTQNDGQLQIPQQVSLFAGGRGGEHFGYEVEINVANAGAGTAGIGTAGAIRVKLPYMLDLGSVTGEIIPFATANGAADSFEVLNTGAVNVHTPNQNAQGVFSAAQYLGTGTNAHGVAFVVSNDDFYVNFAKWGASGGDGTSSPSSNYLRGVWLTDKIPGFDSAIGFQSWSGTSASAALATAASPASLTLIPTANVVLAPAAGANCTSSSVNALAPGYSNCFAAPGLLSAGSNGIVDTKAWTIDAQMLGDVKEMPLTLVASYGRAPVSTSGNPNLFNSVGTFDRSSFNVGAELGLIPNKATVQFAFRRAKSGNDTGTVGLAAGSNATDNAVTIAGTYALALNYRLELSYTKFSGDMYNSWQSGTTGGVANNSTYAGDSLTTLVLAFGL